MTRASPSSTSTTPSTWPTWTSTFGFSINGVAALHTKIPEDTELHPFYEIYPEKFSNKTNGITFRRWIHGANPALASLLDDVIGTDWRSTGDLEQTRQARRRQGRS